MELKDYQLAAVYDEVDGLLPTALTYLKSPAYGRLLILKAITGAGKTVIAADFIESFLTSDDLVRVGKNLCIIWLSKGNANLHVQSGDKLKALIESKDINIHVIENSSDFNASAFYDNDVYVVNWEKLNNIDKDTNELSNLLFANSERQNFRSAIKNSHDVEFVFVIDEFHTNYDTDSYRRIIGMFNPRIILGMTATPSQKQIADVTTQRGRVIPIPVADVIKEQMIKKGVCFNTAKDIDDATIKAAGYDSIDEYFLRMALRKRDILEQKYRAVGSLVVPLLLIQFDDDKSNEDIIRTRDILDKIYSGNSDNAYAIWISETDNKKERLSSPTEIIRGLDSNGVKVLLFKQAVAMGWDCPRAQVLLRYRRVSVKADAKDVSSFDIQTIGRILRMAEQMHYVDDDLNYAYVFVPSENYKLTKEFETAYAGESSTFTMHETHMMVSPDGVQGTESAESYSETTDTNRRDDKENHIVPPEHPQGNSSEQATQGMTQPSGRTNETSDPLSEPAQPANKHSSDILRIEDALAGQNVIAKKKCLSDDELKRKIKDIVDSISVGKTNPDEYSGAGTTFHGRIMTVSDSLLDADTVSSVDGDSPFKTDETAFSVEDTPAMLQNKANKMLKEYISQKHYSRDVKSYLIQAITNKFRRLSSENGEVTEATISARSKLLLLNKETIKKIVRDFDDFVRRSSEQEFIPSDFMFPRFPKYSTGKDPESKEIMQHPLPARASEPERIFESILDNPSNNVKFWFKNKDSGSGAFCVPYDKEDTRYGKTVGRQSATYPDFIVAFNDGSVGIYEIKDYDKEDKDNDKKDIAIRDKVSQLNRDVSGVKFYGALLDIDKDVGTIRNAHRFPEFGGQAQS